MSTYTKRAESRNVTATITVPGSAPKVITHGEARASSALHTLQEMADQLASLKNRLELAMDSIAVSCNAWHCQECVVSGPSRMFRFTTRSIAPGALQLRRIARSKEVTQ